jgi:hypothetical protein
MHENFPTSSAGVIQAFEQAESYPLPVMRGNLDQASCRAGNARASDDLFSSFLVATGCEGFPAPTPVRSSSMPSSPLGFFRFPVSSVLRLSARRHHLHPAPACGAPLHWQSNHIT